MSTALCSVGLFLILNFPKLKKVSGTNIKLPEIKKYARQIIYTPGEFEKNMKMIYTV